MKIRLLRYLRGKNLKFNMECCGYEVLGILLVIIFFVFVIKVWVG